MLLDIVLGMVIVAVLATEITGVVMSWRHLVVGVAFALLPDLDFLWQFFRKREVAAHAGNPEDHRDGLHYPLLYMPAGFAIIATVSFPFAIIFLFTSLFHFAHDSLGTGWGVKWKWPFSRRKYKFFCEKDGSFSKRFLVSWEPSELREIIIQKGDPDWIKNLFLRPLWRAITFQEAPPMWLAVLLLAEVITPLAIIVSSIVWWNLL